MIRRLNYTGRTRIEESCVTIAIEAQEDAPPNFSATLDFSGMELPPTAQVIVEAYRGRAAQRFPWGTVEEPQSPSDTSLVSIPDNPLFRVKVLAPDNSGKLLALAKRIRPLQEERSGSLIWLKEEDLGQEVWRLDFTDANPTLLVNSAVQGIREAVLKDGAFQSLVIPEVVRAVLVQALIIDDAEPEDAEGQWGEFLGFVRGFYSSSPPSPSDEEEEDARDNAKLQWINGAVEAFTETRFHARTAYERAHG